MSHNQKSEKQENIRTIFQNTPANAPPGFGFQQNSLRSNITPDPKPATLNPDAVEGEVDDRNFWGRNWEAETVAATTKSDKDGISPTGTTSDAQSSASSLTRETRPELHCSGCHRLFRLLGWLIVAVVGSSVLATPAVLSIFLFFPPEAASDVNHVQYELRLDVICFSLWAAAVWTIAVVTHVLVHSVADIVVRLSILFSGGCSEKTKSRLEGYIAVCSQLSWVLITAWALGVYVIAFSEHVRPQSKVKDITSLSDPATGYQIGYRLLWCLFLYYLMLFVEKFILQRIAIRFHYTAYNDRIKQNKFALRILDKLSGAARTARGKDALRTNNNIRNRKKASGERRKVNTTSPNSPEQSTVYSTDFNDPRSDTDGGGSDSESGTNGTNSPTSTSPTPNYSKNKKLAARVETEIRENFQSMFTKIVSTEDGGSNFSSVRKGRKLARKLFGALQSGRHSLIVKDFEPYFKTKEEAKKAFEIFDKDGNGDISAREMRDQVEMIYKERKDIESSLRDVSQVVGKLDNLLFCVMLILYAFGVVIIWDGEIITTFVPLSSMVLAGTFLFGGSAKNLFECIIFLFVTHPFDTGDRVFIDNQSLVVHYIGLLSTVFRRSDGQEIYAPNSVLALKFIHNIRRSGSQTETVDIHVAFHTPQETILQLQSRMREFVAAESRDFGGNLDIQMMELENTNRVKLTFFLEHKGNWQDGSRRFARKTKFMMALKQAIMDLGISYTLPTQRIEYFALDNDDMPPPPLRGGSEAASDVRPANTVRTDRMGLRGIEQTEGAAAAMMLLNQGRYSTEL